MYDTVLPKCEERDVGREKAQELSSSDNKNSNAWVDVKTKADKGELILNSIKIKEPFQP